MIIRFSLSGQKTRICILSLILFNALPLLSCRDKNQSSAQENQLSSSRVVTTARGFSIRREVEYSVVTITNPWQGADDVSMSHYLVRKGSGIPEGADPTQVIFVPLSSVICMSTTHVGMIMALGEENSITGLSGTGFVYSDKIKGRISQGLINEVGYDSNLNQELIIKISPDLVMMYGIGSESAGHVNKLKELGINIMFNADYLETDPLGKAEWIKLFGALYCKEELADSIFRAEVKEYSLVRDLIKDKSKERPSVLLGLPFKDTWFISPGNSFISKLIQDAGGNYLWKNTNSSVSMPYGLENVYIAALEADFWLNIGTVTSPEEILLVDNRLSDLKCFKNKNLYNNNKRITLDGGNDYWESGTLRPHIILKDIAAILHPDLFNGRHELFFYRRIN
jgi:iron complex transport system substrate-binding protein